MIEYNEKRYEQEKQKLYDQYGVENDDGLIEKMAEDALTIPCIICGKEFDIDKIFFINDDPYCSRHKRKK